MLQAAGRACACGALLLLAPALALADDFSEFRIPKNRALLWSAGLSTRAANSDNGSPTTESSSGIVSGNVFSDFRWFSDSDPALTTFQAGFLVEGHRQGSDFSSEQVSPVASFAQASNLTTEDLFERWQLAAAHRHYPWAAPVGLEASGSIAGGYTQRWTFRDVQTLFVQSGGSIQSLSTENQELWSYSYIAGVNASAGWGRVRNATGIYDALVLEERLRETGALTRPLSPAARRQLADLMYLRSSLDTVRERPGRFLWEEIERVLSEDGALREGGLDAYSLLRAAEPHIGVSGSLSSDGVPKSPVGRLTGYFLGARVSAMHDHFIDREDGGASQETILNGTDVTTSYFQLSSRTSQSTDRVVGGLAAEVHRPLGPAWQLDAIGSALTSLRAEESDLLATSQLAMTWLAADRWTAAAIASYQWLDEDRLDGATRGDAWFWRFDLSARYYLEDNTALELIVIQDQRWRRGEAGGTGSAGHLFSRNNILTLGVTYRFAGRFEAPGFFGAVSPAGR